MRARDPFAAPGGRDADARLAQARAKLEAFAEQVQRREGITPAGREELPPSTDDSDQAAPLVAGQELDGPRDGH